MNKQDEIEDVMRKEEMSLQLKKIIAYDNFRSDNTYQYR